MVRSVGWAGIVVLVAGVALQAGQPGQKALGPQFRSGGYVLAWGELKTSADVNYNQPAKTRYSFQMDGSVAPPARLDVVAITQKLRIRSVTDTHGEDMTPKAPPTWVGASVMHSAVQDGVAQVQIALTQLRKNPACIRSMTLATDAIIAHKRTRATLPAVVMEDYKAVGEGVSVRIASLRISSTRQLDVTLEYKRQSSGPSGAFIAALYALDKTGHVIGGGRWTEGDPFNRQGRWMAKFKLAGTQVHRSFRIVLVTDYEVRPVTFDVKGVFTPK